jgi:NAD(P)H-dependent FMN reductase
VSATPPPAHETATVRVLLVSGSLRDQSTNRAVIRTAASHAPPGIEPVVYDGLGALPHFNPDDDHDPLPPPGEELRIAIRAADAICFCTPEYAGALPGSFKNLLDWTIGDDQPGSIYEKPATWINASPRGAVDAHDSLRKVLGYAHADIVDDAIVHVGVTSAMVDVDGSIADDEIVTGIVTALTRLAAHVLERREQHAQPAPRPTVG